MNETVTRPRSTQYSRGGQAHRNGNPSSWVVVGCVIVGFMTGGIAVIEQMWWLFWLSAGVLLISVPAGGIVGRLLRPAHV
jgi:hypothetical protein